MGICNSSNDTKEEKPKAKQSIKVNQLSQEDKAMIECKQCRDKIKAYIRNGEKMVQKKKEKVKELLRNKDKERARFYLKQSKFYADKIKVYDGQLDMIETQISNLQTTMQMTEYQKVLRQGNEVLKELQKEVNVEKWQQIGDDLNELKEHDKELTNYFKEHNQNEEEFDNAVDDEIKKMENELGIGEIKLPDAPRNPVEVPIEEKKEKEKRVAVEA